MRSIVVQVRKRFRVRRCRKACRYGFEEFPEFRNAAPLEVQLVHVALSSAENANINHTALVGQNV